MVGKHAVVKGRQPAVLQSTLHLFIQEVQVLGLFEGFK